MEAVLREAVLGEAVLGEAVRVAQASELAAFRISQYRRMRGGKGSPCQRGNLWQGKQLPLCPQGRSPGWHCGRRWH